MGTETTRLITHVWAKSENEVKDILAKDRKLRIDYDREIVIKYFGHSRGKKRRYAVRYVS